MNAKLHFTLGSGRIKIPWWLRLSQLAGVAYAFLSRHDDTSTTYHDQQVMPQESYSSVAPLCADFVQRLDRRSIDCPIWYNARLPASHGHLSLHLSPSTST